MRRGAWLWQALALASAALVLRGCSPPPRTTLSITNNSGQRLSFDSCRGEHFDLDPGARVELTDIYMAFRPELHWGCYRKKPFVVRSAGGERTYRLQMARTTAQYEALERFTGPSVPANTLPINHRYFVEVERDGSIRAGRITDPARPESVEFAADPQPQGFPLLPAQR